MTELRLATTPLTLITQTLLDRCFEDLVEQTKAAFRDRNVDPCVISPAFIAHWIKQGKNPTEIVNIALRRRGPDAHLGGIDA